MITYQYESKYAFNQYGFHDCIVDFLVVARIKMTHLGSSMCEHFDFSIQVANFRFRLQYAGGIHS